MPILSNVQHDFFSEETDTESPVSTQIMQKIGENLNFLNGLVGNLEIITTTQTWNVPEGVSRVFFLAAGGGGGGGATISGGPNGFGGGGGSGAVPYLVAVNTVPLTPYNITIGAGGQGFAFNTLTAGSPGGDTIISGGGQTIVFYGAAGGNIGGSSSSSTSFSVANIFRGSGTYNGAQGVRNIQNINMLRSCANNFFSYTVGGSGSGSGVTSASVGQPSMFASGGANSITGLNVTGGGGAGFGAGAAATLSAAANSSAGGGGNGGNGGSGICIIIY